MIKKACLQKDRQSMCGGGGPPSPSCRLEGGGGGGEGCVFFFFLGGGGGVAWSCAGRSGAPLSLQGMRLHSSAPVQLKKNSACYRQRQNLELGSNTSQRGYDTHSPATPPSPTVSASAHRQGVAKSRKRQSPGSIEETATQDSNHFRKFTIG